VDPTTGLGDVEKRKILPLPGLELRLLGRPAYLNLLDFIDLTISVGDLCTTRSTAFRNVTPYSPVEEFILLGCNAV
jgi:hypothetical protein